MNSENFGMFCSDGNKEIKSKAPGIDEAPWISQLKSVFKGVEDVVAPYATKDNSFNDMGNEIDNKARIYFVVNGGKYRIFGLAKGVGERGRASFSEESLGKLKKEHPGKVFELKDNSKDLQAFIDIVKANGGADSQIISDFTILCNSLLRKLGITERINQ